MTVTGARQVERASRRWPPRARLRLRTLAPTVLAKPCTHPEDMPVTIGTQATTACGVTVGSPTWLLGNALSNEAVTFLCRQVLTSVDAG